jgi:hypothetical protein
MIMIHNMKAMPKLVAGWAGERERQRAHPGARAREMPCGPAAEGPLLPPPRIEATARDTVEITSMPC